MDHIKYIKVHIHLKKKTIECNHANFPWIFLTLYTHKSKIGRLYIFE